MPFRGMSRINRTEQLAMDLKYLSLTGGEIDEFAKSVRFSTTQLPYTGEDSPQRSMAYLCEQAFLQGIHRRLVTNASVNSLFEGYTTTMTTRTDVVLTGGRKRPIAFCG